MTWRVAHLPQKGGHVLAVVPAPGSAQRMNAQQKCRPALGQTCASAAKYQQLCSLDIACNRYGSAVEVGFAG